MTSRRQFLRVGLFSALALGTVGAWRASAAAGPRAAADPRRQILAAVIPVMLAEALPSEPQVRAEALEATLDGVEAAIAGMPPAAQQEIGELFDLLAFGPTRWLLTGIGGAWNEASEAELGRFLARWRHSFWSLPQAGYQALHQIILGTWYSQPRAWAAIGYGGPPALV